MTESRNNNADILLLPEYFITGYDLTINNDSAITENDLAPLCEKANELGIGLVATALTKGNSNPQNSAFVIGKGGKIIPVTLLMKECWNQAQNLRYVILMVLRLAL